MNNIFTLPSFIPEEIIDIIHTNESVRIERIVSAGQTSPDGFWYDQAEDEWVLLVSGEARIAFDDASSVLMKSGAYIIIPAHRRHRVEYTSCNPPCVWICVFMNYVK